MAAPQTYVIERVTEDGRVVVNGFPQPVSISPKGGAGVPVAGQELRGWLNETGRYGPYVKLAQDQAGKPRASAPGRRDANGRSIERQVALKSAVELAAAAVSQGREVTTRAILDTAQRFDDFLAASARSAVPSDSQSPTPLSAEPSASVQGPDSAAPSNDDDGIPF